MQTENTATDTTTTAAPQVDITTPAVVATASAQPVDGAVVDTSTTTAPAEGEGSTQQDEQDRKDNGQFKSGAQKRIDTLVFQRHEAEREAAYWKRQAQSNQISVAPRPADFETDEDYHQAVLQHRIDDGVNRGLSKTAENQANKFIQQAQSAAAETYNQRVADAVARIPDFHAVVSKADVVMTPALCEALIDSEKGPDLVYHLAKNPAEFDRLNNMSVRQMDREIGRLEGTLGVQATKPSPPAARTTSAPPPVKPGSPASAPASNDPSKMSMTDFESWAKANGSKYIR